MAAAAHARGRALPALVRVPVRDAGQRPRGLRAFAALARGRAPGTAPETPCRCSPSRRSAGLRATLAHFPRALARARRLSGRLAMSCDEWAQTLRARAAAPRHGPCRRPAHLPVDAAPPPRGPAHACGATGHGGPPQGISCATAGARANRYARRARRSLPHGRRGARGQRDGEQARERRTCGTPARRCGVRRPLGRGDASPTWCTRLALGPRRRTTPRTAALRQRSMPEIMPLRHRQFVSKHHDNTPFAKAFYYTLRKAKYSRRGQRSCRRGSAPAGGRAARGACG